MYASLPFLSFLTGGIAPDPAPALWDDATEKPMSYGTLRAKIQETHELWRRTPRDLVLGAPPRTIAGVCAYLSAAAAGHALLLTDPSAPRLDALIAAYRPAWIFWPGAMRPGVAYEQIDSPFSDIQLWRRTQESPEPLHPDLFLLQQPSGPSDSTKTVRLSYANIASNVTASAQALKLAAEERALLHLPLSYAFGLSILHGQLAVGGGTILTEKDVKDRSFWENAMRREATLFPGTPLHYEYIARAGLEHLHAPRLKTFLLAGGRMPAERTRDLLTHISARQGRFFALYGKTEASPRLAILPWHDHADKMGSVGHALSGGRFAVESNEIVYYGPNVMMGYGQNRDDLGKGDEQKGRLPLGERGEIDAGGFLFLEGR